MLLVMVMNLHSPTHTPVCFPQNWQPLRSKAQGVVGGNDPGSPAVKATLSAPAEPQKSYFSHLGYSLDGCTVFQKEFHYFNSILLAGNMQRGKAILQGIKTHIYLATFH